MGLKNLATKKTTKAPGKKDTAIRLAVEEVQKHHDEWVNAQRELKDAKAKMELAEKSILEYAEPLWMSNCRNSGKLSNTASVGNIRITWKSKSQFATKSSLDEERCRNVFDKEYGHYFEDKEGPMQFTEEALNDPKIVAELEKAISKIQQKHPEVPIITFETTLTTRDTLFNDYVMRADKHEELEAKLRSAGVQRTKPTFAAR